MKCEKKQFIDRQIAETKAHLFDLSILKADLESKLHALNGAKETLEVLEKEQEETNTA